MDERYELLCEIGEVLIHSGKENLLTVFSELMLEHYPTACFQLSDEEEEEYEPPLLARTDSVKPQKEKKKDIVVEGDSSSESEEDDSEEEGALMKEELTVTVDEKGFHALA